MLFFLYIFSPIISSPNFKHNILAHIFSTKHKPHSASVYVAWVTKHQYVGGLQWLSTNEEGCRGHENNWPKIYLEIH